ncbi:MAG TPA: DUF4831 family protein [Pyrinomonadaceae bacterium]|nr:DUF4831 family protein [Pyrinomonadaceae bacterium]
MRINRSVALTALLPAVFLLTACPQGKTVVVKMPSKTSNGRMDGVFYALPLTIVSANVPLKRTDSKPAQFQVFARCFFSPDIADERIILPSTSFSVETPLFSSHGEPDPAEIYMVKFDSGLFESKSLFLSLNESGQLTKAEAAAENTTADFVTGVIKTAVTVGAAGATSGLFSANVEIPEFRTLKQTFPKSEESAAQAKKRLNDACQLCLAAMADDAATRSLRAAKAVGDPEIERLANVAKDAANKASAAARKGVGKKLVEKDAEPSPSASPTENNPDFTKPSESTIDVNDADDVYNFAIIAVVLAKQAADEAGIRAGALQQRPNQQQQALDKARDAEAKARIASEVANAAMNALSVTKKQKEEVEKHQLESKLDVSLNIEQFKARFEEAATLNNKIEDLQTERDNIVSGRQSTNGLSAEALKTLLSELDDTIKEYKDGNFLGTTTEAIWSADFEFVPPPRKHFFVGQSVSKSEVISHLRKIGFRDASQGQSPGTYVELDDALSIYPKTQNFSNVQITFKKHAIAAISVGNNVWYDVELSPEMIGPLSLDLFEFSPDNGVCKLLATDQGVKVKSKFSLMKACPKENPNCEEDEMIDFPCDPANTTSVSLNIALGRRGQNEYQFADRVKSSRLAETGERGFYYRIPATSLATLKIGKNEKARQNVAIAQLGLTASLPASTGGRKTEYKIDLFEASGALKNFTLGSDTAIQKSNLDDLQTAATTAIEAQDQLKKLERRQQILTKLKEIRELEKELSKPSESPSPEPQ